MSEAMQTRIELLFQVAELMASEQNLDNMLDKIVEHVQRVMYAGAASLYVRIPGTDFLEIIGSRGKVSEKLQRTRLRFGEGIGGTVAQTREPINVADAYQDTRFSPEFDKQTGFRTKQLLSVPMLFQNTVAGVISVFNKQSDEPFNEEDMRVLSLFCSQAAIAIYNAQERVRNELWIKTTSFFSREITNILGREVTLTYGYISQLQRHIAKITGNVENNENTTRVQKVFSALEDSAEQVRHLAVTLGDIARSLEFELPERLSWADFLSYFQKESKYQLCRILVEGSPSRQIFTSKSSVLFVIDTLLHTLEQRRQQSNEDFAKSLSIVFKERTDMFDLCICCNGENIPAEYINAQQQSASKNGLSLVGINSVVELLNGELFATEALVFHHMHQLFLEDYLEFSRNARKSTAEKMPKINLLVLWQLSLPIATSAEL